MHESKYLIKNTLLSQHSQAALADGDLDGGGVDTAKSRGLAVGQLVHGRLGEVEAAGGVVDGEDVDGPAGVGELPAGAALRLPVVVSIGLDKTSSWSGGRWG